MSIPSPWLDGVSVEKRRYILEVLVPQLIDVERLEDLYGRLTDPAFLEAKVEAGMVFELASDFSLAVSAMPSDHEQRRILSLLEEAIRRDIHFIARHAEDYPQALFQCLWNSCWWHDCPEAAGHYEEPEGGWPNPPPWEQPGVELCELLETWRGAEKTALAGSVWVRSLTPPEHPLGLGQVACLGGHTGEILTAVFSQDGTETISVARNGRVLVHSLDDGRVLSALELPDFDATAVALTTDARRWVCALSVTSSNVAFALKDGTVLVWQIDSGRGKAQLKQRLCARRAGVTSLAFHPTATELASGAKDGRVHLWDVQSGVLLACHEHAESINHVAFAPDGTYLASACDDCCAYLWDLRGQQMHMRLEASHMPLARIAVTPNGEHVICADVVRNGCIWSTMTGERVGYCELGLTTMDLASSPSGNRLAIAEGQCVTLVETSTGREIDCLVGHEPVVWSVAFSPDGTHLVSTSCGDRTVRVWRVPDERHPVRRLGYPGGKGVVRVAFSPNCEHMLSWGLETSVGVWNLRDGRHIGRLEGHTSPIKAVSFFGDSSRVVTASFDATVRVWGVATCQELCCLEFHTCEPDCVTVSPSSKWLAVGGADGRIRLWDVAGEREVTSVGHRAGPVRVVAFSPGEDVLASGTREGEVLLWSTNSGAVRRLARHRGGVSAIAFSPDGLQIVTCSCDGTAWMWDVITNRALGQCRVGKEAIKHVRFFSEQNVLLVDRLGQGRVWNVQTGTCHIEVSGVCGRSGLAGQGTLVPIGKDGEVAFYSLSMGSEVAHIPVTGQPSAGMAPCNRTAAVWNTMGFGVVRLEDSGAVG